MTTSARTYTTTWDSILNLCGTLRDHRTSLRQLVSKCFGRAAASDQNGPATVL